MAMWEPKETRKDYRMQTKTLRLRLAATLLLLSGSLAAAQTFPTKPVTVVVPFAVGGTVDAVTRLIAQELNPVLGKPAVVENRTGGGGVVGWGTVARATPDGHTLLTTDMSFAIAAGLIPNLPFDPKKSFTHVSTAVSVPHVLVVNPSVEAKTVQELIALAKANPGKLFYGSGGNGTNTHLGGELFKSVTGTNLVHVPYRGAGAVLTDLMGGQVQALITSVPTALSHIRSGKLRALMVTSEERLTVLPDVPSAKEVGLPEMVMKFWVGFAVPAATPAAVVQRLNKDIVTVVKAPDTQKRLSELGADPVGNTPAEAEQLVNAEIERWTAVIKSAGIKPD